MRVLDINVLKYDSFVDAYKVRYCLEVAPGVLRRSTAIFRDNKLSRDNKKELIEKIKESIKLFNMSK